MFRSTRDSGFYGELLSQVCSFYLGVDRPMSHNESYVEIMSHTLTNGSDVPPMSMAGILSALIILTRRV